ncbi:MAG: hypothetical protein JO023_10395 [Chloroflexi bacterium]|nr:hypothetical protein [Chloroflexota bacterium]
MLSLEMQEDPGGYTVVNVQRAEPATDEAPVAPPEILERFEGRTFTLHELEQRGVRIAGGDAYYTANGIDWVLEIFPRPGETVSPS